ncbi:Zn(II)2Cys6 transcription factor [Paecilomyces variotii]|uniref:Zn(II)2Cys6 transcription factor n=1 Tax=Byssochlamys spectabilis TaxID=264951 RepID=A0A443HNB8_BYSSP|nr:Zn(II)2Cys6 transcription factor [Paecilomyces variotii]KAJ9363407.1 transcriptional regulator family: Fungal Specific TF [Paecilomyces variotii]RWQ93294.1 Zn(II)2Cys6 transcription factor [Paecilomyces variotii]
MESGKEKRRVGKRSSNACTRCRRQKIKCSGSQPCSGCSKRNLPCIFDDRDQKMMVTRGYIIDLQRQIVSLRRMSKGHTPSSPDVTDPEQDTILEDDMEAGSIQDEEQAQIEDRDAPSEKEMENIPSGLTNPLSTGPSAYMSAANGRAFYLGTSSNWSFARRVLAMVYEHIYQEPLPTETLLFDGSAYDLGWDGFRTSIPEEPAIPTTDHAIYLINSVKFHCGQLFHLFDEEEFMRSLYDFYSDSNSRTSKTNLWYIHFLVILAFGKAFVLRKNDGRKPPGAEFFVLALQLLPDVSVLCKEPVISTEILCCIALYLQSLDFRHSSHQYIGQAMRMALGYGMHTDMPVQYLGERLVQRCRKIWWTVYILDREMTSLFGLPQSIRDDHLHNQAPTSMVSAQRTAALNMQIKLSRVIAGINETIYGPDGRLNTSFLLSTKSALASVAGLADEMRRMLPIPLENSASGISRLAAYIHLLYHQCIVLATRPLLFSFLKIRISSPETLADSLSSSPTVRNVLQMCIDSSIQMINILGNLQTQGLLETFLYFDLESVFVSAMVLLLAPVIDTRLLETRSPWLQKSHSIIDDMISSGNLIAKFRKSELQQVEGVLDRLSSSWPIPATNVAVSRDSGAVNQPGPALAQEHPMQFTENNFSSENQEQYAFNEGFTTAQILAVANSIESGDAEWVSQALAQNNIW